MIIFKMNFLLGLAMGFILAAVSPAVVVGAMFELKKAGYGVVSRSSRATSDDSVGPFQESGGPLASAGGGVARASRRVGWQSSVGHDVRLA